MQIDVISDTICPWCFIGKRRLDRALGMRPDLQFDVRWRAFRLDPSIPAEGIDRKAYLEGKFGSGPRVREMAEAIREAGSGEGIEFAFDRIARTPNTTDSHRLIRWAASAGAQGVVVGDLFRAYFEDGQDIGNAGVLLDIAEGAGMDRGIVAELLEGDADRELIDREDMLARRLGVQGVPAFVFDGKFLVPGAQDSDTLLEVIDKVANAEIQQA